MVVAHHRPDQQKRPIAVRVKRESLLKPMCYITWSEFGYCLHNSYTVHMEMIYKAQD
jgi:hypothetical protein